MESWLASVVLALSTNLDNFALGLACGASRVALNFRINGWIALCSGVSTFGAMQLGDWLADAIALEAVSQVGGGLLAACGAIALWRSLWQRLKSESGEARPPAPVIGTAGSDSISYSIGPQAAIAIGLLLALTNLGTGVAAGITQLDPWLTSGCSTLSSLATIGGGAAAGRLTRSLLGLTSVDWLAGALLVSLGVWEAWGSG